MSRDDQEDLVQEVMTAAFVALREHRYDRERGRFKVWLKGVIANKIADMRRARRRQDPPNTLGGSPRPLIERHSSETVLGTEMLHVNDIQDPHPGPAEEFEATFEEEWQKVVYEEALHEIRSEVEPTTFQAFDLVVRKGQKPGDVARLLGLSRNAVYVAKARVQARLAEKIRTFSL